MALLLSLNSSVLKFTGVEINNPHHLEIPCGITAVLGPNGAGKSSLARIIEDGWNFMTNDISTPNGSKLDIRSLEFTDIYSLSAYRAEYYQQRFESTMCDDLPTVADFLGDKLNSDRWGRLSSLFGLDGVIDKRANFLSSGELRKLLIVNVLLENPRLLILDNPYVGLDDASRKVLDRAIADVASIGTSVMLLLSDAGNISDDVVCVVPITDMTVGRAVYRDHATSIEDFRDSFASLFDFSIDYDEVPPAPSDLKPLCVDVDDVVEIKSCQVKYGNRIIIDDVDWSVRRGECWSLTGPNGAGKSTLLSLINADNPQGYSNDIRLFGRKRGSGESIWDIKSRIGYVSPEMHLYFNSRGSTLIDVVGGGLNDACGVFRRLSPDQIELAKRWLRLVGLDNAADKRFSDLSYGQQRMALILRTLIRRPELLILDEPLHGLDQGRKRAVSALIDFLVRTDHSTLIFVTHYLEELPGCVKLNKTLSKHRQ